jgi:hypothetical protein
LSRKPSFIYVSSIIKLKKTEQVLRQFDSRYFLAYNRGDQGGALGLFLATLENFGLAHLIVLCWLIWWSLVLLLHAVMLLYVINFFGQQRLFRSIFDFPITYNPVKIWAILKEGLSKCSTHYSLLFTYFVSNKIFSVILIWAILQMSNSNVWNFLSPKNRSQTFKWPLSFLQRFRTFLFANQRCLHKG